MPPYLKILLPHGFQRKIKLFQKNKWIPLHNKIPWLQKVYLLFYIHQANSMTYYIMMKLKIYKWLKTIENVWVETLREWNNLRSWSDLRNLNNLMNLQTWQIKAKE